MLPKDQSMKKYLFFESSDKFLSFKATIHTTSNSEATPEIDF